jgi:Flp pilus assembly protein TadD
VSPKSRLASFPKLGALCLSAALALPLASSAQDIRLKFPKRSHPTPVQQLNQDGVKAVQKHDYEKAKKLFYKAYLLDPNDPFTLNNLGYVAELDGEIERAQRFYSLAAEQPSEAAIAVASSPGLKGKEVADVAGNAADRQMEVNRDNVYAMGLLLKDRAPEADTTLQRALALDPKNPFTLNNLGFAKEKEGELELALNFYSQAANTGSDEPVVVTVNKGWRGKPIRDIASENASKVRKEIDKGEDSQMKVARLNLRGVSAINRNDRRLARQYFEEAYKMDPSNSFTLNNMGYVSEQDGDRETAQFFYAKAAEAKRSDTKVVAATRRDVEGLRMGAVAAANDQTVTDAQEKALEARRREGGEVSLLRRNNTPVVEPAVPVHPTKRESEAPVLIPREETVGQPSGSANNGQPANGAPAAPPHPTIHAAGEQPTATGQPVGEPSNEPILPPTTEPNAQPVNPNVQPSNPATAPTTQPTNPSTPPATTQPTILNAPPPTNQPQGGVIEPLPDNQQPANADKGAPATQPQTQQQPVGQPVQGVMPPLPDNQQPGNADQGAPSQKPKTTPPPNQQQPPPQR